MHTYRKKTIYLLFCFAIVFVFTFALGMIYIKYNKPLLEVGLPPIAINWIIIILSVLSLIRLLIEMHNIEDSVSYEKRIKSKNI